jgi:hypothetical protein
MPVVGAVADGAFCFQADHNTQLNSSSQPVQAHLQVGSCACHPPACQWLEAWRRMRYPQRDTHTFPQRMRVSSLNTPCIAHSTIHLHACSQRSVSQCGVLLVRRPCALHGSQRSSPQPTNPGAVAHGTRIRLQQQHAQGGSGHQHALYTTGLFLVSSAAKSAVVLCR